MWGQEWYSSVELVVLVVAGGTQRQETRPQVRSTLTDECEAFRSSRISLFTKSINLSYRIDQVKFPFLLPHAAHPIWPTRSQNLD
jgi:hypothetical protein